MTIKQGNGLSSYASPVNREQRSPCWAYLLYFLTHKTYLHILQDHFTALMTASYQGHSAVVKKLLEAGANSDIQDDVCYIV